jgi:transposase-like protein
MSGNGIRELEKPVLVGATTEVVGVARRRSFSDAFKRRLLDEVDRARPGEIGLILRREGLYSSQLAQWRDWRNGVMATKKGAQGSRDLRVENERLEKENARLKLRLRKAAAMLELQKKAAEILGYDDETSGSDS